MTKRDLMDHWDDIVTDPRVTLAQCERHLDDAAAHPYLFDEHQVVASGGSSGVRGIYVYGWDAWATCYASIVRFQERDWATDPTLAGVLRVTGVVAASKATHVSAAIGRTFSSPQSPRHLFPVSRPIEQIVNGLNDLQPTVLMGYSSFLPRLALEARAGRLRISPRRVVGIAEPMLPEARAATQHAWGVPIANGYGMSEGVFTGFCGHAIHLPDDLCLFEPVDSMGLAVAPGVPSQRVLLTNLYNRVLPLIRFEVTDEVTVEDEACPCGSAMRRIADPLGRLDETFHYPGGHSIHPHVFRSALSQHRQVIEYQIHQTERGANIHIVTQGDIDALAVCRQIENALRELGLTLPAVTVDLVARIDRQPTGKFKRFVALTD